MTGWFACQDNKTVFQKTTGPPLIVVVQSYHRFENLTLEGQRMKGPVPIKSVFKTMKILECLSYERSLGTVSYTHLDAADE